MEQLKTEKQKFTIYHVGVLLNRFRHEVDFSPLIERIAALGSDLAKTAGEFKNLEAEVEQIEDSLTLKEKVLKLIRDKANIKERLGEDEKFKRRGRPTLDLEVVMRETEKKKEMARTIQAQRDAKLESK